MASVPSTTINVVNYDKSNSGYQVLCPSMLQRVKLTILHESPDGVQVEIILSQELKELLGLREGGIALNLIDFFCSYLCHRRFGTLGYTESFEITLVDPPKLWDVVVVQVQMVDNGEKKWNLVCDIYKKKNGDAILVKGVQRRAL